MPHKDKRLKDSAMIPGFAKELRLCIKNLFYGFAAPAFLGGYSSSSRKPRKGVWDWGNPEIYEEANYCDTFICRSAVIGKGKFRLETRHSTRIFRSVKLLFALIAGLLTLPFAILRTVIKLILMVPRLCILKAEDHLRKHVGPEQILANLSKDILRQYVCKFIENEFNNHKNCVPFIKPEDFTGSYNLPKYPFGPGHFIYMALYHLAFTAALASLPLLLYKFNKLPHVAVLYSSLGLIAFLSIPFIALNIRQCLKANRNIESYSLTHHADIDDEYEEFHDFCAKVKQVTEGDSDFAPIYAKYDEKIRLADEQNRIPEEERIDIKALAQDLAQNLYNELHSMNMTACNECPKTVRRVFAVTVVRYASRCGEVYQSSNAGNDGVRIIDACDATTDLGVGISAAVSATFTKALMAIREIRSPFSAEERMSLR